MKRMAKDPVCGMTANEKTAKFKTTNMGTTYYFCSAACQKSFENNPGKYTKATAPMHHH